MFWNVGCRRACRQLVPALWFASALVGLTWSNSCWSQNDMLGLFTHHADVGEVRLPGDARYRPENQDYEIGGSGANMWFADDQFHFLYRRMRGDFILRAHAAFVGQGLEPHRKLGWMVRAGLHHDAPYVDVAVHGDGLTSLQFRRAVGGSTEEVRSGVTAPEVIQLERKGASYTMSVAKFGEPFTTVALDELPLGEEVVVGLFVCAHSADVVERAVFRNVRIIVPAPDDFVPYRDYIGSRLEIVDVESGHRQIVLETTDAIQAPNWTIDGKALIYNANGRLYRFELNSRESREIDTGFATANNNDHVLSFDGRMLAISHHGEQDGQSRVYTVAASGGTPKLVTTKGPSYMHGWSPDGNFLVYTGGRDDQYDIYRIPATGGDELRLTTAEALDDGPEYSPDGQFIYFNSARSGRMQLWRMKADGSEQVQITDDEYNNWFPHVSPDGRQIVFLSFPPDVDPGDHPFYKHVYLRKMPIEGGKPQVLAYVYGGQGTINVPSWSPDGRMVAFVSNSTTIEPRRPRRSAQPPHS